MSERFRAFHALPANEKGRYIGNWLLDRAMIIIILLLVIYIQSQRPAFLQPASIINILSLTASRLPIALGIAGCIILTGTDLSAGRIIGLTGFLSAIMLQKAGTANRFIEAMGPAHPGGYPAVMALALIGLVNGFCVAKFKLHPFIVTLSTQLITYGAYLALSNARQIGSLDTATPRLCHQKPVYGGHHQGGLLCAVAVIVTVSSGLSGTKPPLARTFAVGSTRKPPAFPASTCSGHHRRLRLAGATYGYSGFVEVARRRVHRHRRSQLRAGRHRGLRHRRRVLRRRYR